MTAKEYFIEELSGEPLHQDIVIEVMIEFAKFHTQEALKQASEKATMKVEYPDECYSESNEYGQTFVDAHDVDCSGEYGQITIEKDSILNSYPLNLIK